MKNGLLICTIFLIWLPVNGQPEVSSGKNSLDLSIGINIMGAPAEMEAYMELHDFDKRYWNWLLQRYSTTDYPIHTRIGFTSRLSYSRSTTTTLGYGIIIQYSRMGEARGVATPFAPEAPASLDVRFSNLSLISNLTYNPINPIELIGGPALLINSSKRTLPIPEVIDAEKYKTVSAGLYTGFNLVLREGRISQIKIGLHHLLSIPTKIGPFTSEDWMDNNSLLPETKLGFGHLSITFSYGFHF